MHYTEMRSSEENHRSDRWRTLFHAPYLLFILSTILKKREYKVRPFGFTLDTLERRLIVRSGFHV